MDFELGLASATLEPAHLNHGMAPPPSTASGGGLVHVPGALRWALVGLACLMALCLTTTVALVAVHYVQTQRVTAKLDFVIGRVSDIPALIDALRGDIVDVQGLVSDQGARIQWNAATQGERIEQLVNATVMLIEVLQEYFEGRS